MNLSLEGLSTISSKALFSYSFSPPFDMGCQPTKKNLLQCCSLLPYLLALVLACTCTFWYDNLCLVLYSSNYLQHLLLLCYHRTWKKVEFQIGQIMLLTSFILILGLQVLSHMLFVIIFHVNKRSNFLIKDDQ